MVEITCNKRQKEKIIEALLCPEGCLWPRKMAHCAYDPLADCRTCFEKKIKWHTDGGKPKEAYGRWNVILNPFWDAECSECGYAKKTGWEWRFCPNCGAKMDGGTEL
jgi:hypothetical protein